MLLTLGAVLVLAVKGAGRPLPVAVRWRLELGVLLGLLVLAHALGGGCCRSSWCARSPVWPLGAVEMSPAALGRLAGDDAALLPAVPGGRVRGGGPLT